MKEEIDRLLALYEKSKISRRSLIEGVAAMSAAAVVAPGVAQAAGPMVRGRTLNHVTLTTTDVGRSKAFYQRLLGLSVRDEGDGFCDLQLENGFLGLYAPWESKQRIGIDHVCLGIDEYEPKTLLGELKAKMPDTRPTVEFENQLYLRDPDGTKIQLAGVSYKR
ncbi:VOC family protein [Phenylobacterium sp.]|jgi:catechol 2,3-dioxygenase-like lactoylglutathione lyase family enzyme|uniref:VOC family protein n=1 Tax=Phenylobacterium sp. TaxID=1871053 RepID=UPI002F41E356